MKINAEKICIVKTSAIGDVINTLPLVNTLRNACPNSSITWVVEPKAYPVVRNHPAVDEFILFERQNIVKGFLEIRRKIKDRKFDLVLDLQRIFKSGLITHFTHARDRLGFDFKRSKEGNWIFTNLKINPGDKQRHMIDQYFEFAEVLGIEEKKVEWGIELDREEKKKWDEYFQKIGKPCITINVGASEDAKMWYAGEYARLIEMIKQNYDYEVIVIGGYHPKERKMGGDVKKHCRVDYIDKVAHADLRDLIGVLNNSEYMISPDTGPMHLAVAVGTPTIGLFGAQNPRRTGPYGYQNYVVDLHVDCSPCFKKKCPYGHHKCMVQMKAEHVMEKLELLMEDVAEKKRVHQESK